MSFKIQSPIEFKKAFDNWCKNNKRVQCRCLYGTHSTGTRVYGKKKRKKTSAGNRLSIAAYIDHNNIIIRIL